jgi:AMP-binding enzyme C-terminal domain
MEQPAVAQALSFAVPCRTMGERVYAAVVLEGELSESTLRRFVGERLARFKVPEKIFDGRVDSEGPDRETATTGHGGETRSVWRSLIVVALVSIRRIAARTAPGAYALSASYASAAATARLRSRRLSRFRSFAPMVLVLAN